MRKSKGLNLPFYVKFSALFIVLIAGYFLQNKQNPSVGEDLNLLNTKINTEQIKEMNALKSRQLNNSSKKNTLL